MNKAVLLQVVALVLTSCGAGISVKQDHVNDGWRQEVDIPALNSPSSDTVLRPSKVVLWIEQGWLCVRRTDAEGAIEWQVVLARPTADIEPAIDVSEKGVLDIAYGHHFIRENFGRLRILRQRKDAQAPAWPMLEMRDPIERTLGSGGMPAKSVELKAFVSGGWCWVTSGLANDRPDIWLRLERKELQKPGYGFEGGPRPARVFFGDHHAIDEGDQFTATRSSAEASENRLAALKLRETLGTKPAPSISSGKWFNSTAALSITELRDKVVLLDFWGTWCGPCVEKLPATEALHKKYSERGLVVIGVHSKQASDSVAEFLEKQPLPFPIAVDTGETAKRYGVNSWPTYFLIDKSGKVQWGFSRTPPSDAQIEELLR